MDIEGDNSIIADPKNITLKSHLTVPPTPKRKGKKTNSLKRTFLLSSKIYQMEHELKMAEKEAAEKMKQEKQMKLFEKKQKALQMKAEQDRKKILREELKLKKSR